MQFRCWIWRIPKCDLVGKGYIRQQQQARGTTQTAQRETCTELVLRGAKKRFKPLARRIIQLLAGKERVSGVEYPGSAVSSP